MLGPFDSGGRFGSELESALRREPLMKTLVAFDRFAMRAATFHGRTGLSHVSFHRVQLAGGLLKADGKLHLFAPAKDSEDAKKINFQ